MPIDFSNAWKTGVKSSTKRFRSCQMFFPASRRSWQVSGAEVGTAAKEASGDNSIARAPGPDRHFCPGFFDCIFRGCAIVQSR